MTFSMEQKNQPINQIRKDKGQQKNGHQTAKQKKNARKHKQDRPAPQHKILKKSIIVFHL
jgi:ribosomal protein L39E